MTLLVIIIVADGDTIKNKFLFLFQTMPSTMEKPDIETVRAVVHKILVMYPEGVTREELLSKILYLSRVMRKPTFWFPTWSDTNQTVQSLKMARGLKFWIKKVEGLHYLCSENKGADQLRGYREDDLRLCFRICKMLVFS